MKKQDIFILSLFQHGDKARYSTLSHLLRGKRTTSILMYGFLYGLLPYFSLLPKSTEAQIKPIILRLIEDDFLLETEQGYAQLTEKGQETLANESLTPHQRINSFQYGRVDEAFRELLLFGTQVISEAVHHNKEYQPIEQNSAKQGLLKGWLQRRPESKEALATALFNEWWTFIHLIPEDYQNSVVASLSGFQQIGQTTSQLAEKKQLETFEAYLIKKNMTHLLLKTIFESPKDFPIMGSLYGLLRHSQLNESAQKTWHYYQQGYSIEELTQLRQLKRNTISDHIIELAIFEESFDFSRVLPAAVTADLEHYLNSRENVRQWQYGQIKNQFTHVSFFEFRCFQIQQVRRQQVEED